MEVRSLGEVQEYFSNINDILKIHRKKFLLEKEFYKLEKKVSIDYSRKENFNKMVIACSRKIATNDSCVLYLDKIFSLCNSDNSTDIYDTCHDLVKIYDDNIKYFDDRIVAYKLANRGIKYISSLDCKNEFRGYAKEKYDSVKKLIK